MVNWMNSILTLWSSARGSSSQVNRSLRHRLPWTLAGFGWLNWWFYPNGGSKGGLKTVGKLAWKLPDRTSDACNFPWQLSLPLINGLAGLLPSCNPGTWWSEIARSMTAIYVFLGSRGSNNVSVQVGSFARLWDGGWEVWQNWLPGRLPLFFNDADLLKDGWRIRDKSKPKEESNQPFQRITLRSTAELFISDSQTRKANKEWPKIIYLLKDVPLFPNFYISLCFYLFKSFL